MNRRVLLLTLSCAWCIVVTAAAQQGPAPSGQRTIVANGGVSILGQLSPNDKFVRVVSTSSMPLLVEPPAGTPLVKWMTDVADASWLVQIVGVAGRLNDDSDFVDSDVTATMVETFKSTDALPRDPGQQLSFAMPGGETAVGTVRIKAVVPWMKEIQVGRKYVMFANWDKDNQKLLVGAAGLFEETRSGFSSLLTKAPKYQQLDGSPEQTLRAARRAGAQITR